MKQILKYIEHCGNIKLTHLNVNSEPVPNSFQIANYCYQGQSSFNTHTLVPSSFLSYFQEFRLYRENRNLLKQWSFQQMASPMG
jgi:hypothetical protein